MTIRAILFDFDGTLADSFDAIIASVNHVRQHNGLHPLPDAEIRRMVGWGLPHLMRLVVPHLPVDQAVSQYREHHPSVIESGTRLFPGVVETLTALHTQGYHLGVCSNKAVHFTRELLGMLHIREYFQVVMGPEDVDGRAKPAPDMVIEAMQRLGVQAAETLYIGDMSIDVETARGAGVPVWVIPSGTQDADTLRATQPDRLLNTFADIQALIKSSRPI